MIKRLPRTLWLILPLALWAFLMKHFLLERSTIGWETLYLYSAFKFFLANIKAGVLPLWNPFLFLGFPQQISLFYFGLFNPCWLIALILNTIGIHPYSAFLYSITLFILSGQIAFYLLAKDLLKSRTAGLIAFVLVLFMSPLCSAYLQFHPTLVFVPAVWFLFFFFRFLKNQRTAFLLGAVLSAIVGMTTYMPYFFLTVIVLVFLVLALFYGTLLPGIVRRTKHYVLKHPLPVVLCTAVILLTLWPALLTKQALNQKEILTPFRHAHLNPGEIFTKGMQNPQYRQLTDGALTSRMSVEDLYSRFDEMNLGNDGLFFLSLPAFVLILLGAVNPTTKKTASLLLFNFAILLLVLENSTPFHRWLFDHVSYFRLMRNLQFFLPFLGAGLALLAAEQCSTLIKRVKHLSSRPGRILLWLWVLIVHAGFFVFLIRQTEVPVYSFSALALSFLIWSLLILRGRNISREAVAAMILICIVSHSLPFFWRFTNAERFSWQGVKEAIATPLPKPVFSHHRSLPQKSYYWSNITMTDAPGSLSMGETFTSFWGYFLYQNFPAEMIDQYSANKFYLYREIQAVADTLDAGTNPQQIFGRQALVHLKNPDELPNDLKDLTNPDANGEPLPVPADSAKIKVIRFDMNSLSLSTDLLKPAFLVYTESYDKSWRALLDGETVSLYRANVGFKGLAVPAGKHTIRLMYRPWGGTMPYWAGLLSAWALFAAMIFLLFQTRKDHLEEDPA